MRSESRTWIVQVKNGDDWIQRGVGYIDRRYAEWALAADTKWLERRLVERVIIVFDEVVA